MTGLNATTMVVKNSLRFICLGFAKCLIEKPPRSEAMIPERKLKNLNRIKLVQFIEKYGIEGPRRGFAGLGADL